MRNCSSTPLFNCLKRAVIIAFMVGDFVTMPVLKRNLVQIVENYCDFLTLHSYGILFKRQQIKIQSSSYLWGFGKRLLSLHANQTSGRIQQFLATAFNVTEGKKANWDSVSGSIAESVARTFGTGKAVNTIAPIRCYGFDAKKSSDHITGKDIIKCRIKFTENMIMHCLFVNNNQNLRRYTEQELAFTISSRKATFLPDLWFEENLSDFQDTSHATDFILIATCIV